MGSTFFTDYEDQRTLRSGWGTNIWNDVSVWNCGFTLSNSNGVYTNSTTSANSVPGYEIFSHAYQGTPILGWKSLKFWQSGQMVADFRPAISVDTDTVGLYDEVRQRFFAPTDGTWLSGPEA